MRYLILDGNSLYATGFFSLYQKENNGPQFAVWEFINRMLDSVRDVGTDALAVCFDGDNLWRKKEYPLYKTHRGPKPPRYYDQLECLIAFLQSLKVPIYREEGYEADDLCASLARSLLPSSDHLAIVQSGDSDLLQLVRPGLIELRYMKRRYVKDEYEKNRMWIEPLMVRSLGDVRELMGVEPHLVADLKAIEGDNSDNLPGVNGIGRIGAVRLIRRFGGLEDIYREENLGRLVCKNGKPGAIQHKLVRDKELAFRMRDLVLLSDNVRVSLPRIPFDTISFQFKLSKENAYAS